jgi:hypothetical protein
MLITNTNSVNGANGALSRGIPLDCHTPRYVAWSSSIRGIHKLDYLIHQLDAQRELDV